jgi:hypothetical protein
MPHADSFILAPWWVETERERLSNPHLPGCPSRMEPEPRLGVELALGVLAFVVVAGLFSRGVQWVVASVPDCFWEAP